MAEMTVELRHLLMSNFKLFDFPYQFDDVKFKEELETHVIEYYYSYEIGQETPDMFKQKFKARWLRMIGYYNELYNTTLLTYNPLVNHSMSEALEQLSQVNGRTDSKSSISSNAQTDTTGSTNTGQTSTTAGTVNVEGNTKTSDYPQQSIAGGDYLNGESDTINNTTSTNSTTSDSEQDITSQTFSQDSTSNIGQQTNESTNNSTYEKTIEGITGTTYQELVRQQRQNLLRIPDMVVREMANCFMLVY